MNPLDWVSPPPANCPMSRSWLKRPKSSGARATPHGAFQPITMFETAQEPARGTINVHNAEARAVGFKARTFFVQRISDDNVVADGLHVERRVVAWQFFIHKGIFGGPVVFIAGILIGVISSQFYKVKRVVINIHTGFVEVSCV